MVIPRVVESKQTVKQFSDTHRIQREYRLRGGWENEGMGRGGGEGRAAEGSQVLLEREPRIWAASSSALWSMASARRNVYDLAV